MNSATPATVATGTTPCTFDDSPVWVYGMSVLTTPADALDLTNLTVLQSVAASLAAAIRDGQGLAAPQVDISSQMFIFRNGIAAGTNFPLVTANAPKLPDGTSYQVIINPTIQPAITHESGPVALTWSCPSESCMSIPGFANNNVPGGSSLNTKRLVSFTLSYATLNYATSTPTVVKTAYTFTADDLKASPTLNWVLQHEVDHVNGILFTQRCITPLNAANQSALEDIAAGKTPACYPIVVPPNQLVCPNS